MPDYKKSSKNILENHLKILNQNGYEISEPELSQYNYNADISNSEGKVKLLVYFSNKGNKVTLQGNKELGIYQRVYNLIFGENLFQSEKSISAEPESYIGTDESGKGDYFGPLIVAAVFADKSVSKRLKALGVKDSKELPDYSISSIAAGIRKLEGCIFSIVVINPEKYNILYEKMGNLNRLLGWAHAKALENILSKKIVPVAISDKFGNEKYIQTSLQELGKKLILHQETKAEKYTAVAAASILARNEFNKWFYLIKQKHKLELPKGASANVEIKAKEIKSKYGAEVLKTLAKLHFKTTKKIN